MEGAFLDRFSRVDFPLSVTAVPLALLPQLFLAPPLSPTLLDLISILTLPAGPNPTTVRSLTFGPTLPVLAL
jgi:hypothetical protein